MAEILLQTRGLTKKYGEFTALDSVSIELNRGDIYGLIGRNGAGKTTFFKCVMGLAKPTAGEIEFGGNASRKRMGFMINPSFFPYLNPYECLKYLCVVKGIDVKGEAERLLKLVGLDGLKKPFKTLSLGMKQRLGIAGALLGSPPVVVLDEPINGLDPQGIIEIREVIKNIHELSGTTFIISSHILSELDLVATRFGFIERGALVKEITRVELHEQTKESLYIEVDDVPAALAALETIGVNYISVNENRLTLRSHTDKPHILARVIVNAGVELYGLHRREITLEEYFIRLIGGGNDV